MKCHIINKKQCRTEIKTINNKETIKQKKFNYIIKFLINFLTY